MPSLKAIRKKIVAVKGTQKITRAMKLVSASKLRKAQDQIIAARPYAYRLAELVRRFTAQVPDAQPLTTPRAKVRRVLLIVLTSDRGLCGGFNSSILKKAERFVRDHRDGLERIDIIPVGRKAIDFYRNRGVEPAAVFREVFTKLSMDRAEEIAEEAIRRFVDGVGAAAHGVDEVFVVYNEFKNAGQQKVVVERLLPVIDPTSALESPWNDWLVGAEPRQLAALLAGSDAEVSIHGKDKRAYTTDASPADVLAELLPRVVRFQVLRCLFESSASEHGARMAAMDSASSNAKKAIGRLSLQYNRARQAAITKELMEVVAGAEAV